MSKSSAAHASFHCIRKLREKDIALLLGGTSPRGKSDAMFEVSVNSDHFENLTVFSMSSYVSKLLKQSDVLEVNLADAEARINWLNKLYS